MAARTQAYKEEQLGRVARLARERLPRGKSEWAERFIRQYYANVPDDVLAAELDQLYGAAMAFYGFARTRLPGAPKIRAYNPRFEDHGWKSNHTVVEIVNDDMPFLVDSVTAEINRRELTVHLVVHPILRVKRDGKGALAGLWAPAEAAEGSAGESWMHLEIDEESAHATLEGLCHGLERVLGDVRAAVEDWPKMRGRLTDLLARLDQAKLPLPAAELAEAKAFLGWVAGEHFTFLGSREYDFSGKGEAARMEVTPKTGLGILRDDAELVYQGRRNMSALPPDVQAFLRQPMLLTVNKSDRRSTVHRPTHLDVLTIKKFRDDGEVAGERLFVGLFTSAAYHRIPRDIPLLRHKVANVMTRSGFAAASHDGKALLHILESYPREDLFQIEEDELFEIAMGILHLQERQRIALFMRKDPFERFVSCLTYVPRERYNTELRQRFGAILETAFNGTVSEFEPELTTESALARVHFIVATTPGAIPDARVEEIELKLVEAARSWPDKLKAALVEAKGEERGLRLLRRYGPAFPTDYRERFNAHAALVDIDKIESVLAGGGVGMHLYRPLEAPESEVRFKIYNTRAPVALSDILPMLEGMGLRVLQEVPFLIAPHEADPVYLHDFGMARADGVTVDLEGLRESFQDAFARVLAGEMEADGFNRLVLAGGLVWREVVILRAYCKYLRQTGITFSQTYMEETLTRNPRLARRIVELFLAHFDPARQADAAERSAALAKEIEEGLDKVESLDEDRIIRRFVNLVQASLRTNYFQKGKDGEAKPYFSVKLDSRKLEELPEPHPLFEIWVYSPRMEGIHLRGGRVARGGIRWSDRREDFRTEILGLMKTQMVKNTVIVRVGSKGGFVVKRPPAEGGREALMTEVVECYRTLMRGMLDLTDNIKQGKFIPPKDVVRRDEDDAYLVVAADKGTATFSDIANAVSRDEYGFWLDDAYASGGSAGYDHKKMGITAKGAWESVKRHFREAGRDIQSEDFTVVGIGDMSGDVFGNGMLLSQHIKLIGAFNHLHIFVDPAPDPKASLAERRRLFDLPRSSWSDYDPRLISPGGGVFERKAKSIRLSPEMKRLFALAKDAARPAELIHAMLKAPVDLLWFGGIGTYIKAREESQGEAGDRANDALRVDAEEIRAKVIGEGANLGVTQRGRVAFALAGGRINTDAIDNSAGVATSDHEVNLKILLGDVVSRGDMTMKQRDQLLRSIEDEVGAHVLEDNYQQPQALTVAEAEGPALLDDQMLLIRNLERAGRLNRAIEFLPEDKALNARAAGGKGLTRPELAAIMAYAKLELYDLLLPSDLPDDPTLVEDLVRYFPRPLREGYRAAIERHSLKREIIATTVTNSIVNRGGATFVNTLMEKCGVDAADVARAYTISRQAFGLATLWHGIEALDNKVEAAVQTAMLVELRRALERVARWLLTHGRHPLDVNGFVGDYGPGIARLWARVDEILAPEDRAVFDGKVVALTKKGVPLELARPIAGLDFLVCGCDIVRTTQGGAVSVEEVGRIYFAVGARFGFDWLRGAAEGLAVDGHWQKLAVAAIIDDLYAHQSDLVTSVLAAAAAAKVSAKTPEKTSETTPDTSDDGVVAAWAQAHRTVVARVEGVLAEIKGAGQPDLAMLAVANRQLRQMMAG
ncbi:MAG TPA: NAD-glutamate dehydrogenase [Alphaproteobacteria bacterium]|nr:NAD-glutamate dehydrogenase [Alphaproteobacteria bacterium]